METPEQYNLSWKNFRECTTNTFRDLLRMQEFSDVTLVCDDDRQLHAHKVVLSACSPFFRNILLKNPHQHPLIYLTGVSQDYLSSMVSFMYLGQTNVAQEDLTGFMAAASKFQIKGLSEDKESGGKRPLDSTGPHFSKSRKEDDPSSFSCSKQVVKAEDDYDDCEGVEEEEGGFESQVQSSYSDDPVKWPVVSVLEEESGARGKWGFPGDEADYETFKTEEGLYACDHCQFSTKNKSNLKAHRNAKHLGVKYPCDQCDYKASYSNHLRQHKRVKHEGVHFPCDLCLFTTSQKSKLKLHMREKHCEVPALTLNNFLETNLSLNSNHSHINSTSIISNSISNISNSTSNISSTTSNNNPLVASLGDTSSTNLASSSVRELEAQLGQLQGGALV